MKKIKHVQITAGNGVRCRHFDQSILGTSRSRNSDYSIHTKADHNRTADRKHANARNHIQKHIANNKIDNNAKQNNINTAVMQIKHQHGVPAEGET